MNGIGRPAEGTPKGQELRTFWRATANQIDRQWIKARLEHDYLGCRVGCDRCCHSTVYITAIDAALLSEAFQDMSAEARADATMRAEHEVAGRKHLLARHLGTACPLLFEGRCGIYDKRPLICRRHGFTRLESNGGLNMCPENAAEVSSRGTAGQLPVAERPLAAISLAQASKRICTYLTVAEAVLLANQFGLMTPEQVDANYQTRPSLVPAGM